MADYSWVDLQFKSQDPGIVEQVQELMGGGNVMADNAGLDWSNIGAETVGGWCEEAEAFLQEKGIAYSRTSDGKYEYDGDESHWEPGMETPRVFTRLNNGGRILTQEDITQHGEFWEPGSDEELGAFVREHFAFRLEAEKADVPG